jgi:magnesium transporter
MAGLVIRGLAVHEMAPGDWWRVLTRELALGAGMGIALGLLAVGASRLLFEIVPPGGYEGGSWTHSFGVGVSVATAVMVANLIGAMVPMLFKKIGLDPAVTSGPFLAALMDITGVMIYFTVASLVLQAWGG